MIYQKQIESLRDQKFGTSEEAKKDFNQWLSNRYGVHKIELLFEDMALRVIDDLRGMLSASAEPQKVDIPLPLWMPVLRLLAKLYLRGMKDYSEGKRYSTVEEVIEIVKEEINR